MIILGVHVVQSEFLVLEMTAFVILDSQLLVRVRRGQRLNIRVGQRVVDDDRERNRDSEDLVYGASRQSFAHAGVLHIEGPLQELAHFLQVLEEGGHVVGGTWQRCITVCKHFLIELFVNLVQQSL